MELYIDTANLDEIREASKWGIISGVTTNPSLLAKEGRKIDDVIDEIESLVDGPISVEVVSTRADEMVEEAREVAQIAENIAVKIPMTTGGLAAASRLEEDGIACNVTLVFSANQALMAARAGASFVSPFVGRLDDIGADGIGLIGDVADIFAYYDIDTRIISASLRHPKHVHESAMMGAHIATVPYDVLEKMASHPLTDSGLQKFLDDWKSMEGDL